LKQLRLFEAVSLADDVCQLGYKYACKKTVSSTQALPTFPLRPSMKFTIAIASLLASAVSAASLQARQYNDGQLLSPAAGATVTSGSEVTIQYHVYDSL
jgi:hypothetical protein